MSLLKSILGKLVPADPNTKVNPIAAPTKYKSGGSLYFPEKLSSPGAKRYPHMMKFSVHNFESGGGLDGRKINEAAILSIFLHIPDNLAQTMVHDYSLESVTAALARYGLAGGVVEDIKKVINEGLGDGTQDLPGVTEAAGEIIKAVGGGGAGTTELLNALYNNRTVNPKYEMLYKGTKPREFTFDFKLAPQSAKESESILNIIKAFRYYSAPAADAGFRYLIPPNPFKISFYFAEKNLNNALFNTTYCALQGVDVNYSTTGQFATFKDGMPVEIAIQLRFAELQALNKELISQGY